LVASNDAAFVKTTIAEAIASYRENSDTRAALESLSKLKGIRPALASLLLAVHDPEGTIFFSHSAYSWLCSGGAEQSSVKLHTKEYFELHSKAKKTMDRLGASALDVEKVAYILMNPEIRTTPRTGTGTAPKPATAQEGPGGETSTRQVQRTPGAKREQAAGDDGAQAPLRRSKRVKSS
jgi:hypothetical protein